jgi:uncharacterized protein YvpB
MYNFSENGLGVYHKPIYGLLDQYMPGRAIDITGSDFENVLFFINNGIPAWVIINSTYKPLPDNMFETWQTGDGEISVTNKEHSVLVTGYDENYIYFNDPLGYQSHAPRQEFEDAWRQMGSQAVTVSGN